MSTPTLKPRPVYKKKTVTNTKKTMTEHSPTKTVPVSLTVQSHLPEITLISRQALWNDFQNRMRINNYEVGKAMEDLKEVVKQSQPYVSKAIDYGKEKVSNLRSNKD